MAASERMGSRAAEKAGQGPFGPGECVENRYRVGRILGSGGMGVVYEAEHVFTGGRVAIKALYNRAGDHRERMRLEARALAEIRHPNVVPVTDGGVTPEGIVWFAMPLLDGQTLRAEIWRKRGLGVERALRIGIQIASGLAEAHRLGLIHRDLKPENVFVVREDDSIRVLDFGTSKFQRGELKTTDRFRVIGTHAYMSPERIQADLVDHRADIYALGHILYEMLCGMHALSEGPGPLDLPPIHELGLRQIYAKPPPLEERAPGIPSYVSAIVYRALAKDRKQRHASMDELARELTLALERHLSEPKAASGARVEPPAQTQAPAELTTERMSPAELGVEAPEPSTRAKTTGDAEMSRLEAELIRGAARFACAPGRESKLETCLGHLTASLADEPALLLLLERALAGTARASEAERARLRRALVAWSDTRSPAARGDAERALAIAARSQAEHADPAHVALGAGMILEPEARLEAAENALFALQTVPEDIRAFAIGVLIAFSRASALEQQSARGALLALMLGGPEDTELARAELAKLVMDTAGRGAEVLAPPPPRAALEPPRRAPTPAASIADLPTRTETTPPTPSSMTTPVVARAAATDQKPRANPIWVAAIGLGCFGLVLGAGLLLRHRAPRVEAASQPSVAVAPLVSGGSPMGAVASQAPSVAPPPSVPDPPAGEPATTASVTATTTAPPPQPTIPHPTRAPAATPNHAKGEPAHPVPIHDAPTPKSATRLPGSGL